MTQKHEYSEGFLEFMDMLTAYRKTRVLMCAHELGIFEALTHGMHRAGEICAKTGMDESYGTRFLEVLAQLGFLERHGNDYGLGTFARRFLTKGAHFYQGESLEFEKTLTRSWNHLSQTLVQGKRVFNAGEKSPDEYQSSLDLYLHAMDNAARIRAGELWRMIQPSRDGGLILDAGAGSGAFLKDFLNRNPSWNGVFCDLPDVVALARNNPELSGLIHRIDFRAVNLLDEADGQIHHQADILLCSNLVHCQGVEETRVLLSRLAPHVSPSGCLIVHDFFTDQGPEGAMYDLHMMLNTYNGRTYSMDHVRDMMTSMGFIRQRVLELDSSSMALVFSKEEFSSDFFV